MSQDTVVAPPTTDTGSATIPDSQQLVILEEGIEIQHTKSYGIGIDCHSKFIQISVLVKRELRVYEYRHEFSTAWGDICAANKWAKSVISSCSSPSIDLSQPLHYCIESTSTYHLPIIQSWGGVPSIVNPSIAGSTKRKTDVLDAKLLAIHDLTGIWPESFIPSKDVQELRAFIRERNYYSDMATRMSNRIANTILKFGYTVGKDGSVTKSPEIRKIIEDQISDNPHDYWPNIPPDGFPKDVRQLLRDCYSRYDQFVSLRNDFEKRSIEKAKAMSWQYGDQALSGHEVLSRLTTASYVGEWTATVWLSIVVTTSRFPNAKALSAYCGLDPSLKVSAKHVTSTVKRGGNKDLHYSLSRSASNLIRIHNEPFGVWGYNIYLQSGRWKKAVNAVARKLAVSLYYMQKNGETFSYEQYKIAHKLAVIDIPLQDLININKGFKRYVPLLAEEKIYTTSEMVDAYQECRLHHIKGLGKKFFNLIKEFINNQEYYVKQVYSDPGEEDLYEKESVIRN